MSSPPLATLTMDEQGGTVICERCSARRVYAFGFGRWLCRACLNEMRERLYD